MNDIASFKTWNLPKMSVMDWLSFVRTNFRYLKGSFIGFSKCKLRTGVSEIFF